MLDDSRIASAQRSWSLTGPGSANSLQPHPDTLHRGFGWGRLIDEEFLMEPLVSDFRCNAVQATGFSKERTKTQYPLIWHQNGGDMSAQKNKKNYVAPYEFSDAWDDVLNGDRDAFKEMIEPLIPSLVQVARQDIKREKALGNLPDKILAEELVGDALIQAWRRRYNRSPRKSLTEWLLANQRWALRLMVLSEKEWAERKVLSLEEPAGSRLANNDNDDWDWITPQFLTRPCWRDVIADENSVSHVA